MKIDIAPRIIDSAFEILKPLNAKISTAIIDGSPEQSIIDTSVDSDMDMIVMGARGIKGIESILIGSTTKSVAMNSPKPVIIIKLPVFHNPDKIKILFATGGSEYQLFFLELGRLFCLSGILSHYSGWYHEHDNNHP